MVVNNKGGADVRVFPSIASSNCLAYGAELERIREWKELHIDIEDGNFTPNITFGLKTAGMICHEAAGKSIQVHLMAREPGRYLEALASFQVQTVFAHIEALDYPMVFINRCHQLGMEAGIALNIRTPVSSIEPFHSMIDSVLIMTSEPDGGSECVYPPAVGKALRAVKELPDCIKVMADGGLRESEVERLSASGAYGVVLGRLVFGAADPMEVLKNLGDW